MWLRKSRCSDSGSSPVRCAFGGRTSGPFWEIETAIAFTEPSPLSKPRPRIGPRGSRPSSRSSGRNHPARAVFRSDSYHRSIGDRPDRRTDCGRVIDAVVRLHVLENRMKATAIARSHVGVLERAFEKRFARRAAILLEIGGFPGGELIAKHPFFAHQGPAVRGSQQLPVAKGAPFHQ